jgi:cytoskeleton protein RodZ
VEQPSAGKLLRQAREAAGLHVAGLASALKVPVHKLEALESDDYAAFADTVFMRALAASVCRSLRLDPVLILDKLPRSEPKGLAAQPMQLNAPIKERAGSGVVHGSPVSRKALGAVLVLLLGAAIVYFMPYGALDEGAEGDGSLVTLPQSVEVTPAPAAAQIEPALPAEQFEPVLAVEPTAPAAAEPAGAVPVQPTAAPPAATPASAQPAATAPTATPAPAVPAAPTVVPPQPVAASALGATADMLVFHATGESWVRVTDAQGVKLLDRHLAAGETARVSASAPLSVVVGRSDLTTVQVRGQTFDLTALSRKNVARFEVKE